MKIEKGYDGFRASYEYKELVKQIDSFIDTGDKVLIISRIKDYYIEISSRYAYLDLDIDYISLG